MSEPATIEPTAAPLGSTKGPVKTTWLYFKPGDALFFKVYSGCVDVYPDRIWPRYETEPPPVAPPEGFADG